MSFECSIRSAFGTARVIHVIQRTCSSTPLVCSFSTFAFELLFELLYQNMLWFRSQQWNRGDAPCFSKKHYFICYYIKLGKVVNLRTNVIISLII